MARIAGFISPLIPFIFAAIALAFTIVTLTSRDWTSQKHYDPSLDMKDWKTPLYSIYRSPFRICEVARSTASNTANTTTYTLHCNTFRAYGFDRTSCETVYATQNYSAANTGDERLCQQIHRAGNLAITSTAFIGLGFVLTLVMMIVAYVSVSSASKSGGTATARGGGGTANGGFENGDYSSAVPPAAAETTTKRPSYTPYLNLVLIVAFSIGGICAFLSQFYGILGFIQSQPDNGAFASGRGNVFDPTQDNAHMPWTEGMVLKAYVTCAWVFSASAAGAAGAIWSLPNWQRDI